MSGIRSAYMYDMEIQHSLDHLHPEATKVSHPRTEAELPRTSSAAGPFLRGSSILLTDKSVCRQYPQVLADR